MKGQIEYVVGHEAILDKGWTTAKAVVKEGNLDGSLYPANGGVLVRVYKDGEYRESKPVFVRYEDLVRGAMKAAYPPPEKAPIKKPAAKKPAKKTSKKRSK